MFIDDMNEFFVENFVIGSGKLLLMVKKEGSEIIIYVKENMIKYEFLF